MNMGQPSSDVSLSLISPFALHKEDYTSFLNLSNQIHVFTVFIHNHLISSKYLLLLFFPPFSFATIVVWK